MGACKKNSCVSATQEQYVPILRDENETFVHDCKTAECGDKTAESPRYKLKVTNLPDPNA